MKLNSFQNRYCLFFSRFFRFPFKSAVFFSLTFSPFVLATKGMLNSNQTIIQTCIATKNLFGDLQLLFSNLDKQSKALQIEIEKIQLPPNNVEFEHVRASLIAPKVTFFFNALRKLFERRLDKLEPDYANFSLDRMAHEEIELGANKKLSYRDLWIIFEIQLEPEISLKANGKPLSFFGMMANSFEEEKSNMEDGLGMHSMFHLTLMTIPLEDKTLRWTEDCIAYKKQCTGLIDAFRNKSPQVIVSSLAKQVSELINASLDSRSAWPEIFFGSLQERVRYLEGVTNQIAVSFAEHMHTLIEVQELAYIHEKERKFKELRAQAAMKQKTKQFFSVQKQPLRKNKRQAKNQKKIPNKKIAQIKNLGLTDEKASLSESAKKTIAVNSMDGEPHAMERKNDTGESSENVNLNSNVSGETESVKDSPQGDSLTWEQEHKILNKCIQYQKNIIEVFKESTNLEFLNASLGKNLKQNEDANHLSLSRPSKKLLFALQAGSAALILKYSPQKVAVLFDDLQIEHVLRVHSGDIKLVASYKDPALGKYVLHMLGKHCKSSPQKLKKELVDFLDYWQPNWRDLA